MKHRLKILRDTALLHHPALPKSCLAILNSVIPKIPTATATLKVLCRRRWYRCFYFKRQKRNEMEAKLLASTTQQRQGKGWEDGCASQCPLWHVWRYDILQSKDLLCYFRSESQTVTALLHSLGAGKRLCIALIFHKGPCVHLYCIKLPQNI